MIFCAEKRTEETRMSEILSLFSSAGGIGKSTFAYHLSRMLAKKGKKVLLLDAAFATASLDVLAGKAEQVVYTLSDVANELCDPLRAALPLTEGDALLLFPASPGEEFTGKMLAHAVRKMASLHADFIIIDALLSQFEELRAVSDKTWLLTDPRPSSLRSAEAIAAAYESFDSFLLTFASFSYEGVQREATVIDIVDRVALPLFGVLPYTPSLRIESNVERRCAYQKALTNILCRLLGEKIPLLKGVPLEGMSRRYYIERMAKADT